MADEVKNKSQENDALNDLIEQKQLIINEDGSYSYNMTMPQIVKFLNDYKHLEGTETYNFLNAAYPIALEGHKRIETQHR